MPCGLDGGQAKKQKAKKQTQRDINHSLPPRVSLRGKPGGGSMGSILTPEGKANMRSRDEGVYPSWKQPPLRGSNESPRWRCRRRATHLRSPAVHLRLKCAICRGDECLRDMSLLRSHSQRSGQTPSGWDHRDVTIPQSMGGLFRGRARALPNEQIGGRTGSAFEAPRPTAGACRRPKGRSGARRGGWRASSCVVFGSLRNNLYATPQGR